MIEVYDHEVDQIEQVWDTLRRRYEREYHSYQAFEREATERFARIGFIVKITWYRYSVGGVSDPDAAMPEISIEGRTDPKFEFDPDRQVHEVTANILDIPGQEGVIRTDDGGVFKSFLEGGGDHGHGHGH